MSDQRLDPAAAAMGLRLRSGLQPPGGGDVGLPMPDIGAAPASVPSAAPSTPTPLHPDSEAALDAHLPRELRGLGPAMKMIRGAENPTGDPYLMSGGGHFGYPEGLPPVGIGSYMDVKSTWTRSAKEYQQKYGETLSFDPQAGSRYGIPNFGQEAGNRYLAFKTYGIDKNGRNLQQAVAANDVDKSRLSDQWIGLRSRPSLRDQWTTRAGLSPEAAALMQRSDENLARSSAEINRMMDRIDQLSAEGPAGQKQRDQLIGDLRRQQHEQAQQWKDLMSHPPVEKPVDMLQNFGSLATALMLAMGFAGRHHLNIALASAGTMMQAINTNNHQQFAQAYGRWKDQSEMGLKALDLGRQEIRDVLDDDKMARDEWKARLDTLFQQNGQLHQLQALRENHYDRMFEAQARIDQNANSMRNQLAGIEAQVFRQTSAGLQAQGMPKDQADAQAWQFVKRGGAAAERPPRFGTPDDLMKRWHEEFVAKEGREPSNDEIAKHRAELIKEAKPQTATAQNIQTRLEIAANEVSRSVEAMAALPFGTTLGMFGGAQAALGPNLGENMRKALANKLTPESSQVLKTLQNGVSRGLAILTSGGAATGLVGLAQQLQGDVPAEGDTGLNIAAKFADIRQIVEAATEVLQRTETIGDQSRELMSHILKRVTDAVPFTTVDVARLAGKPSDQTLLDFAEKAGLTGPKPGDIVDGFRFKGGYRGDRKNWEKVEE